MKIRNRSGSLRTVEYDGDTHHFPGGETRDVSADLARHCEQTFGHLGLLIEHEGEAAARERLIAARRDARIADAENEPQESMADFLARVAPPSHVTGAPVGAVIPIVDASGADSSYYGYDATINHVSNPHRVGLLEEPVSGVVGEPRIADPATAAILDAGRLPLAVPDPDDDRSLRAKADPDDADKEARERERSIPRVAFHVDPDSEDDPLRPTLRSAFDPEEEREAEGVKATDMAREVEKERRERNLREPSLEERKAEAMKTRQGRRFDARDEKEAADKADRKGRA